MTAPIGSVERRPAQPNAGFWVFGYGSLMWNPGFAYLERVPARLQDYARAFALASHRYRGTPENPGRVLGLDWQPGAHCDGIAFRVCHTRDADTRDYLHEREMVTRSYIEVVRPVTLLRPGGTERVDALAYVLDRTHPQYVGRAALEEQAGIIAHAHGPAGSNREYLLNTVEHLVEIGIDDPDLVRLAELVRAVPPR